jgi:hypothetical protein
MDRLPGLGIVANFGVGYDSIDLAPMTRSRTRQATAEANAPPNGNGNQNPNADQNGNPEGNDDTNTDADDNDHHEENAHPRVANRVDPSLILDEIENPGYRPTTRSRTHLANYCGSFSFV